VFESVLLEPPNQLLLLQQQQLWHISLGWFFGCSVQQTDQVKTLGRICNGHPVRIFQLVSLEGLVASLDTAGPSSLQIWLVLCSSFGATTGIKV